MAKKGDIIILAALLVLAVAFPVSRSFSVINYKKKILVIKLSGKEIEKTDLSTVKGSRKIVLDNPLHSKILVRKGMAGFIDAACPDKICEKAGWLTDVGQTAVCIPGKVIIKIEGDNNNIDVVAY